MAVMRQAHLLDLPLRITAADIANPIRTRVSPSTLISEIDWSAEPDGEWPDVYALVEEHDRPLGILGYIETAGGLEDESVSQHFEQIQLTQVMASNTPLEEVLAAFGRPIHDYYVLLTGHTL